MFNFAQARQNMIDCQLLTNGIIEPEIVEAFAKIPRETFLPEAKQCGAYTDEDLILQDNSFCMEPVAHARMVQALAPEKGHAALNIGDMTGYSSAILSEIVSTVVTLEPKPGTYDKARGIWDELGCCNIAVVQGNSKEGSPEHAPYDLIFINGSVVAVPDALLDQLAVNGRLVCILKDRASPVGQITLIQKIADGQFSTKPLYDSSTPYIPGFEPEADFVF